MKRAFSLIELIIVVAILGILAAISVPNFLSAQIRAKLVKTLANMKSIEYVLEAYFIDKDTYPRDRLGVSYDSWPMIRDLTTPISYLSNINIFRDPFRNSEPKHNRSITHMTSKCDRNFECDMYEKGFPRTTWVLAGHGPDEIGCWGCMFLGNTSMPQHYGYYQPSNGLISAGDIYRVGGLILPDQYRFRNIEYMRMN